MTKDIKTPEERQRESDCYLLRRRAARLRAAARELEEIAQEIESQCGCNTLSLGGK
jgi:hypothetical protein